MDKSSAVYRRAVKQEYGTKSSIYRSGRIVAIYKILGGVIEGRTSAKQGLSRWFREQWIQVVPG